MVLMFWTTGGERYVKEYEFGGSYCRAVFVSHYVVSFCKGYGGVPSQSLVDITFGIA